MERARTSTTPAESHPPQREGVWIPIEIWELAEAGDISFTELRLYILVNSLARRGKEPGCFASNAYLADKLKMKPRWVQITVQKGLAKGFLVFLGWKKVGNKKFRVMETAWSRVKVRGAGSCASRGAGSCALRSKESYDSLQRNETNPGLLRKPRGGQVPNNPVGEGDMPLEGVNLPPRKPGKHAIQDEDVARAKRLREALVKHHLVSSPRYSARKWATEFRRVVNLREATEEEVDQVLTWYCDQAIPRLKAGDPVLQVLSGAAFYEKWDQLKLAHERSVRDNPTVEITDLGRQIGTSLLHLKWPKGSDADLYTAVQLTLDTYRAFLRRLGKVASRPEHVRGKKGLTRDRVRDLADYLSGVLSSPATFTVNWIKDVHQKAVYAKQAHGSWKGSLVKSALRSVDDKDFKAMVEGAAGRYGAGESTLAKLWEEIK